MFVLNGRSSGDWYTLQDQPIVFGRSEGLLASILDPCVSRKHLEVRYEAKDERYYAVELGSRNGIYINNRRIQGSEPLNNLDTIRIGDTLIVFRLDGINDDREAKAFVTEYQEIHRETIEKLDQSHSQTLEKALNATIAGDHAYVAADSRTRNALEKLRQRFSDCVVRLTKRARGPRWKRLIRSTINCRYRWGLMRSRTTRPSWI